MPRKKSEFEEVQEVQGRVMTFDEFCLKILKLHGELRKIGIDVTFSLQDGALHVSADSYYDFASFDNRITDLEGDQWMYDDTIWQLQARLDKHAMLEKEKVEVLAVLAKLSSFDLGVLERISSSTLGHLVYVARKAAKK